MSPKVTQLLLSGPDRILVPQVNHLGHESIIAVSYTKPGQVGLCESFNCVIIAFALLKEEIPQCSD